MASRFNALKADAAWQKVWDDRHTFAARLERARFVPRTLPAPVGLRRIETLLGHDVNP